MNIALLAYTHPQLKQILQYTPEHVAQIQAVAPDAHVTRIDNGDVASLALIQNADIVIMSPLDHTAWVDFAALPNLKWVHLTSAGASEVAAKLKNTDIILSNSSGVHPIPIAEHVCTYMLMFVRQMHIAYKAQLQQQHWVQEGLVQHLTELHNSTVGIVGFGRIGERIAEVSKGFGARVIALAHTASKQSPFVDEFCYGKEGLNQLMHESDFVINCLPLTQETTGFFNKTVLGQMKPSAYFINIGRGKTVVEQDLIEVLERHAIAGAGLDVFAEEPLPQTSKFWQLDNVIITPHYAGWTPQYLDRVIEIFCTNLQEYMQHKTMPTLVDKSKGY